MFWHVTVYLRKSPVTEPNPNVVHTKGDKKKSEVQKVRIWGGIVYAIYMYRGDLENTHMI